eukprot:TRINITY_DN110224_c0_g1_i1.p1 TRINITY_DN110224_c0_g1~~TRINITY_DN110224_c0_g1_i1.p1  ORF type:complete len:334 (+),score=63.49 TRINITY_DN110224_c0_g1_i1:35-1036(+)
MSRGSALRSLLHLGALCAVLGIKRHSERDPLPRVTFRGGPLPKEFLHPKPSVEVKECGVDPKYLHETNASLFLSEAQYDQALSTKTWLATYPGCGSTWVRTLLEAATGMLTGSIYCDPHLQAEFKGECRREDTLVIKTHCPNMPAELTEAQKIVEQCEHDGWSPVKPDDKAIVIERHPLHAAHSWINYEEAASAEQDEIVRMSPSQFNEGLFPHFAEASRESIRKRTDDTLADKMKVWQNHAYYWHNVFKGQVLFVKFEHLIAFPEQVFKDKILPFLGVRQDDDVLKRLSCAIDVSSKSRTRRTHSYDFQFTEEDKFVARTVAFSAKALGYDI